MHTVRLPLQLLPLPTTPPLLMPAPSWPARFLIFRQILSTNTRRTKVVELSTGTHRVADELRRHSLTDGCACWARWARCGHTPQPASRLGSQLVLPLLLLLLLDAAGCCRFGRPWQLAGRDRRVRHRAAAAARRCREGGHYSTNLDRNRYGSDNNYLFTGEACGEGGQGVRLGGTRPGTSGFARAWCGPPGAALFNLACCPAVRYFRALRMRNPSSLHPCAPQ